MSRYRRAQMPGGTFFFTVVTHRRRPIFAQFESRRILGDVVREVRERHAFSVDAWVLLPDHLHCIWTLPGEDSDFSMRWGLIKSIFSRRAGFLSRVGEEMSNSRRKHRESTIWQRRFWEHWIRDYVEYRVYMDYTHYNPAKHGLVTSVRDWPFSTFHRYVGLGIYPEHWGGERDMDLNCEFGE